MRTVPFSWTVGLLGLVSIAGCGVLPLYRERPADPVTTTKVNSSPVSPTYENYATAPAPSLPKVNDAPWPTAPIDMSPAKPIAVLPPRKIELSAQGIIDAPEVKVVPEIARKVELSPAESPGIPAAKKNEVEKIEIRNSSAQVSPADQFKSVTGQVQQFRKTWRLRYAPVDQDDPYGGSVLLEGSDLDRLRDGQRIRVQGVLIPPTDRCNPTRYRVQTMEILE